MVFQQRFLLGGLHLKRPGKDKVQHNSWPLPV
jgi:hypothetical protein